MKVEVHAGSATKIDNFVEVITSIAANTGMTFTEGHAFFEEEEI